jgi:glycosyltransferase involved in cell wall biosynthesis
MSVLYITYDGLTDPLGQSQILPYLTALSKRGHRITILSCEKRAALDRQGEHIRKLAHAARLEWHPLIYHKWPPILSSAYDLARLRRAVVRLHRAKSFSLVHCRSYIPAAAGLLLKTRFNVPLIFDMRGFWPEEKAEGGTWNLRNPLFRVVYRQTKKLERRLLRCADSIISLTEAGRAELQRRPELRDEQRRIAVIPCCVDTDHFALVSPKQRQVARRTLEIADDATVLTYLGSLGGNYLLSEMLDFYCIYRMRHPNARFLVVTCEDAGWIRAEAARKGIDTGELVVLSAKRDEVPGRIAAANHGIAFKRPSFSAAGCSPTKIGEMLAVGLPVIANAGVGDVAIMLNESGCGATVESFHKVAYEKALDEIENLALHSHEIRAEARRWFDLEKGVSAYEEIYRGLQPLT